MATRFPVEHFFIPLSHENPARRISPTLDLLAVQMPIGPAADFAEREPPDFPSPETFAP